MTNTHWVTQKESSAKSNHLYQRRDSHWCPAAKTFLAPPKESVRMPRVRMVRRGMSTRRGQKELREGVERLGRLLDDMVEKHSGKSSP